MPIKFPGIGSPGTYISGASYEKSSSNLILKLSPDDIQLIHKTPLNLDTPWEHKYSVHLFRNEHLLENQIFQVFDHSADEPLRIGWMIPLAALESDAHDYFNDIHFLNYARAAIYDLWMPYRSYSVRQASVQSILGSNLISLEDVYHEDAAVLVISRTNAQKIANFSTSDYLHSLFKYGYLPYRDDAYPARLKWTPKTLLNKVDVRLVVKRLSKDLKGDSFLHALFSGELDLGAHPLASFLLLYQVLELLIERVFNREKSVLLGEIEHCKTVREVKEATKKIQDTINEEGRLKRLCSEAYLDGHLDLSDLHSACASFLRTVSRSSEVNPIKCLYQVRNLVVHEFRSVTPSAEAELALVNNELMLVLVDILSSYKEASQPNSAPS